MAGTDGLTVDVHDAICVWNMFPGAIAMVIGRDQKVERMIHGCFVIKIRVHQSKKTLPRPPSLFSAEFLARISTCEHHQTTFTKLEQSKQDCEKSPGILVLPPLFVRVQPLESLRATSAGQLCSESGRRPPQNGASIPQWYQERAGASRTPVNRLLSGALVFTFLIHSLSTMLSPSTGCRVINSTKSRPFPPVCVHDILRTRTSVGG
jgi:hypothetical protein